MAVTTRLGYDPELDRWMLDGVRLHCGDGLEVRVGGHWLPVRMERTDRQGWVLYADDDQVRVLPSRRLEARPTRNDARRPGLPCAASPSVSTDREA